MGERRRLVAGSRPLQTHKTDRNDDQRADSVCPQGLHMNGLEETGAGEMSQAAWVGQRVTLENQIRGLAVVFGVRLPRALSPAFIRQALRASEGIPGLSTAMRGLVAARAAVLAAVVAIDGDIKRMVRGSDACRRLMSIPGVTHSDRPHRQAAES
jgi:transposase